MNCVFKQKEMRTKHLKKVLTKEKWGQAARFTTVVAQERCIHINSREGLSSHLLARGHHSLTMMRSKSTCLNPEQKDCMHQLFCMEELMKKNHQMWIPGMTVCYCISFLSAVAQCTFPQARSIMLSRQFKLCLQAIHLWNQATWLSVIFFEIVPP